MQLVYAHHASRHNTAPAAQGTCRPGVGEMRMPIQMSDISMKNMKLADPIFENMSD